MLWLFILTFIVGSLAKKSSPIVYSYSSAPSNSESYEETTLQPSYETSTTTESEEVTTTAPAEVDTSNEKAIGEPEKELLQPRFFAYSDQYKSRPGGSSGGEADEEFSKGGGQEHNSKLDVTQAHKGGKGYKDYQKFAYGQKGVHDKESHKGKYSDSKGKEGKKKEEGGHFGLIHHKENGNKVAKYGESGEHHKGHHTKGEHNIHKKDEYVRKHEFYDEHHEGGEHEKKGGNYQLVAKKRGKKKRRSKNKNGEGGKKASVKGRRNKSGRAVSRKGYRKKGSLEGKYQTSKRHAKKGKKRRNM